MNIIIPMAGRGTRLRPHTLTTPKPLIKLAGKTIVQRLVEEISASFEEAIDNIGFVVGDFGTEVEEDLIKIAEKLGANGHIFYQDRPLGTAHAVLCAEKIMTGSCVIAFADTLFKSDFNINKFATACDQKPSKENYHMYLNLIREEMDELEEAIKENDRVEQLDALIDILVVTLGAIRAGDFKGKSAWKEVMKTNFAKINPETGRVIKREDGKVLKPKGWEAPKLKQFI